VAASPNQEAVRVMNDRYTGYRGIYPALRELEVRS
jgi:hypothetical protein